MYVLMAALSAWLVFLVIETVHRYRAPAIGEVVMVKNDNPFETGVTVKQVVLDTRQGYVKYRYYMDNGKTGEGSMTVPSWNRLK